MNPGDKFHRLTILKVKTDTFNAKRQFYPNCLVQCDCDVTKEVNRGNVSRGLTKSCGCLFKEVMSDANGTHRMSNCPEYGVWLSMKSRCKHKSQVSFRNYGGRGIKVCDRWQSFEKFYSDMGERPSPDHQIERLDNDGDYEPGNCTWVLRKAQCRNRRSNRKIMFRGETKTLVEWCEIMEIDYNMVEQRLRVLHWSPERALTEPSNYYGGVV